MDTLFNTIQALAEHLFREESAPTTRMEEARRRTVVRRAFARMVSTDTGKERLLYTLGLGEDCPVCGSWGKTKRLDGDSAATGNEWRECLECHWHFRIIDGKSEHPDDQPTIMPGKGTQPDPRARSLIAAVAENPVREDEEEFVRRQVEDHAWDDEMIDTPENES